MFRHPIMVFKGNKLINYCWCKRWKTTFRWGQVECKLILLLFLKKKDISYPHLYVGGILESSIHSFPWSRYCHNHLLDGTNIVSNFGCYLIWTCTSKSIPSSWIDKCVSHLPFNRHFTFCYVTIAFNVIPNIHCWMVEE